MLFLAMAAAASDNPDGYPAGEKHALLAFVGDAADNSARAFSELTKRGWSNVSITESAPASVASLDSVHPHARAAYEDALKDGFAALVFSEPAA